MGTFHHLDNITPTNLILIGIQSHRIAVLPSLVQSSWLALDALAIHAQNMEVLPLQSYNDANILGTAKAQVLRGSDSHKNKLVNLLELHQISPLELSETIDTCGHI